MRLINFGSKELEGGDVLKDNYTHITMDTIGNKKHLRK